MAKVVVVGGGISGLATAYAISEKAREAGQSHDISVLESDHRLGGKIKSDQIDGYLCETGPIGFIDNKPRVLEVVHSLGLDSDLSVSKDAYRNRYLVVDGKLQLLPTSPPAFIKTKMLSWPAKMRAIMELRTKPSPPGKDESIAEFSRRHLGKEIVDKLVAAMAVGIFAGDAEKLSVKSCFPVMLELEKEGSGSLLKAQMRRAKLKRAKAKAEGRQKTVEEPKSEGMVGSSGKLTTFRRGMAHIIDRLKEVLDGQIITGFEVTEIARENDQYEIKGAAGEQIEADIVVLAAPAYAVSKILANLDADAAKLIGEIPYAPVNVIVAGYQKSGFGHDLDGFGFLASKREKRGILGCLWNTSIFDGQAPADKVALRVMVGGAINPDATALDDDETLKLVQKELRDIMGISNDPEFNHIIRYKRAIPQYNVGHEERMVKISALMEKHPALFLTGNAFRGVGFNDCVINAEKTAERVVEAVKEKLA